MRPRKLMQTMYGIAGALAVCALVACGGKVVVDGGASGSGAAGGGGSTTVTAGAGGCSALGEDLDAKLAAAQACDPNVDSIQCSGKVTATNGCGCTVTANDGAVQSAALANQAYDAWVAAGCGPIECFACPPPPPAAWYCDPTDMICKPAYEK